ncbi:MAG: DUF2695 domain-containing protein [Propionibacteriaceae bacterium]|nr:DUF2695 domain-containing protein [Propionibacteriaceae bacterium]
MGEWSGREPALPAPRRLRLVPEVQEAEAILADASSALLDPPQGECLLCYVGRMVDEFGCDGRLRFATHYRDARAPSATALERRLGRRGGYCDCEIFLNGYDLRPEFWTPRPRSWPTRAAVLASSSARWTPCWPSSRSPTTSSCSPPTGASRMRPG